MLSREDLQGFTSLGFDDHVKLLFPCADQNDPNGVVVGSTRYDLRDFTPRRFDAQTGELWIDFATCSFQRRAPSSGWLRKPIPHAQSVAICVKNAGWTWIKAAGYWQRGAAGAHQTIADDD